MKNLLLFLIYICIVLFFCRCPIDREYRLEFYNLTSDTLGIYLALGNQTAYPDTILPADPLIRGAAPHEKWIVWIGISHEKMIRDLPKDTLSVFIIHDDTIKKYRWQEIREGYKILKRYDLSLGDLTTLNFTIPYPPDEEMKDMKMYPPYRQ